MALVMHSGALGFHFKERITATKIQDQEIDAHHLFPKKWLNQNYHGSDEERLGLLVEREASERQSRLLTARLRRAKLRFPDAVPEDINYREPRGLDRALLARLLTGGPHTAFGAVLPPAISSVTLSPAIVVGGTSSMATVTLTSPAGALGVRVGLASSNTSPTG